jgi:predicted AAA+ superfamily ATPase
VAGIELYSGKQIDPANTLLIFDEVQEVPKALTSLKYFTENAPEYQIVCAGSLLGVALHEGTSFPVGKVEFLDLRPLSFFEFLNASGNQKFVDLLAKGDFALATVFKQNLIDLLNSYYFVGGMPEAVQSFVDNQDYRQVRAIQQRILDAYEQDFSKHAPNDVVPRIRMVWNSVSSQLAKDNKKFIYGLLKEGARAKEFELALMWLVDCGLIHKVQRVSAPNLPLKAYEDLKAFKLFLVDVGLLGCMSRLQPSVLLDGNNLFKEFKGYLTEQYVLQELKTIPDLGVYYWTNDKSTAEVDFLVDTGSEAIPIEAKAETNLKAKSLKSFYEKYHPKTAIRTSMSDYRQEDWLWNLPLWAVETIISQQD